MKANLQDYNISLPEIAPDQIDNFLKWKESLVSRPDIMGGATTFPNSRLTVRHVSGMLERGVDPQEILEDYSYLNVADLEFAHLFVQAYPDSDGNSIAQKSE